MASNTFSATIDLKLVRKMIKHAEGRLRNTAKVFEGPIRESVSKAMQRQFESRGQYFGTPWRPLSATTRRLRSRVVGPANARRSTSKRGRAKHGFATPLRDTDRLYQSMVNPTGPETVRIWGDGFLKWGTRVPYAYPQQVGFRTRVFGRGRLVQVPARPMLPTAPQKWPARVKREWVVALARHLVRGGEER